MVLSPATLAGLMQREFEQATVGFCAYDDDDDDGSES